ncbi:hypothetical protein TNCV_711521 [Trichonephila clavipes]|nr:hypothetical protein TNCV_711521 [Trichonephila clavipes]
MTPELAPPLMTTPHQRSNENNTGTSDTFNPYTAIRLGDASHSLGNAAVVTHVRGFSSLGGHIIDTTDAAVATPLFLTSLDEFRFIERLLQPVRHSQAFENYASR